MKSFFDVKSKSNIIQKYKKALNFQYFRFTHQSLEYIEHLRCFNSTLRNKTNIRFSWWKREKIRALKMINQPLVLRHESLCKRLRLWIVELQFCTLPLYKIVSFCDSMWNLSMKRKCSLKNSWLRHLAESFHEFSMKLSTEAERLEVTTYIIDYFPK